MKTIQNTILITGGSAGIGFEIARLFTSKGNTVIITGRDKRRLIKAATELPDVIPMIGDVTNPRDIDELVSKLQKGFPALNMVINNAGRAWVHDLSQAGTYVKALEEIETNYLSIVRLNEKLIPLLKEQREAAIINVSSVAALVPNHKTATYGASKAALHSYTTSLRLALAASSKIRVFEVLPPLVNTDFSQEIGGAKGISPVTVAEELLKALEKNEYEIHIGKTALIYELSRTSPYDALMAMNPNL